MWYSAWKGSSKCHLGDKAFWLVWDTNDHVSVFSCPVYEQCRCDNYGWVSVILLNSKVASDLPFLIVWTLAIGQNSYAH